MVEVASALARKPIVAPSDPSRMLAPSKEALLITWPICLRMALKSLSMAVREALSAEGSIAATTFSLSWLSRSEIDSPAVMATSVIDVARLRLALTADRAPMSALCPWAIDQTAALSLALLIFSPVETRSWVMPSSSLVLLRFCKANRAALLVWTLRLMSVSKEAVAIRADGVA